jgi:hypothetical protein
VTVNFDQLKEQLLADEEVRRMIGHRAHEIYLERRPYRDAHPAEDWLRAESEVLPRLIDEMIARNERAIDAHDVSDPVAHRAAELMQEELELTETTAGERSAELKATGRGQLESTVEALASASDADDTVPNAQGVLSGEPVKPAKNAAAKKPAAKKAAPKPAAKKAAPKPAAKKAAAKPAAKKAAEKPAAKKPATKKAPAKKKAEE